MTTPEVLSPLDVAAESIREQFAGHNVEITHDPDGVRVVIGNVYVGDQYEPSRTWLGFRITNAYPYADVYPHYIGPVTRKDRTGHGTGISALEWQGRPALQLSRRSNGWNPRRDSAALKAAKVLSWFAAL